MYPLHHRHRNSLRYFADFSTIVPSKLNITTNLLDELNSLTLPKLRSYLFGQALDLLVSVRLTHYCAYLATYLPHSLCGVLPIMVGYLILGPVSRLDAFSVYPIRTRLPGRATGVTTGTPEVRPSRSSRTKDRSPQISCAHDR